jgi:hypothetical protein
LFVQLDWSSDPFSALPRFDRAAPLPRLGATEGSEKKANKLKKNIGNDSRINPTKNVFAEAQQGPML